MTTPRDWDAATYDRIADPMTRWGGAVLDRLALDGDETVLDAGCGSGRVTEQLAERLPRGHVVALDASPRMLEEARERLGRFGNRVTYVLADLARSLPLPEPVDAVFSTATFHWVPDHDALFGNLAAVMRPGARLVAQCGGAGNVALMQAVLREIGDGWTGPWVFAGPEETRARLESAGFEGIETWLNEEPTELGDGEPFEEYLRTVCLGAHLDRMPEGERPAFVRQVAARMGRPLLDYVRLNIVARRRSS